MSIFSTLDEDLKNAMRNKDQAALKAIRSVKSAILLLKSEGGNKEITEEDELKLINRLVKQRRDSIEVYTKNNRNDLAEEEQAELKVLEKYLPAQMSEDEIREIVQKIIEETGVSDPAGLGKVMQIAMKQLAGKADGKTINQIARQLLTS
ncbi:MAG TPA: GatB/YqeY domain-containing protein [Bacteroidia bacterium]|nr:GatB/YqeY domain-containing protein [Sphingobacteriales bacterium]HPD65762.1 GatB/YqeY domain-containing protein [Bacteroidia bacterium]HRS59503.1 GatB/YqeY domain-containing protein [Bacteroidia bacterium]HRU67605.1 GatB/YqeY domain-containing protein [Bacteroidia bacterium]